MRLNKAISFTFEASMIIGLNRTFHLTLLTDRCTFGR